MKRRIRVITKATTTGQLFSDIYNGWFKGERLSDDQIRQMSSEQRIEIEGVRYGQEGRMRNLYRHSTPSFKDVSQTYHLKL